jgi:hypothetical protein
MKDVEFTSLLLLFADEGAKAYSQDDLDAAYLQREEQWDRKAETTEKFKNSVNRLDAILRHSTNSNLSSSRLRNQADFYSLYAAIVESFEAMTTFDPGDCAERLSNFLDRVNATQQGGTDSDALAYYAATRSASNDAGPRRTRIDIIKRVLTE